VELPVSSWGSMTTTSLKGLAERGFWQFLEEWPGRGRAYASSQLAVRYFPGATSASPDMGYQSHKLSGYLSAYTAIAEKRINPAQPVTDIDYAPATPLRSILSPTIVMGLPTKWFPWTWPFVIRRTTGGA
jgi:hypothetical protein